MNPYSNSTSTLSASPPASVAEKPPRPLFPPQPPAWASAWPSLGETASATTFSSTPDTAISGAFRSNPPSATPSRAIASKPPDGRPPTLATKSISSSPGSSPKICGTSSHSRFRLTQEPALLSPRRTQSALRKISRGMVPDGLSSLRTNRTRANRTRLRQPEPSPRLLPLRATLRPLRPLPSAPSINVCQFVSLYLEAQGREVGPIPIHVGAGALTCPNSARMNPPPLDLNRCHPEDGNPSLAKDSQRRIYAFSPLC